MAVCKGIRENNLVQLIFSFRPGASLITVDSYVDGTSYSGTVTIVVNGRRIDASRTLSLKDFSTIAKAFRREVHLGPQGEWGDGYQMLGDRSLHQFINFVEDHSQ